MECFSVKILDEIISRLQPGDWFVVDVDDTLITPKAMMFRPKSRFHTFLDDLKKAKPHNLEEILSTWRLNRKVVLVEEKWSEILENLKSKGVIVLALTQVNTGKFGKIASMEQWRAGELSELGLTFSPLALDAVETIIATDEVASLYQGILCTGSHSKSAVLKAFIDKYHKPNQIVFVDDRLAQVAAITEFCESANIPCQGIHYLGASKLTYEPSKDCGAIQTKMISDYQWLEDEDISLEAIGQAQAN